LSITVIVTAVVESTNVVRPHNGTYDLYIFAIFSKTGSLDIAPLCCQPSIYAAYKHRHIAKSRLPLLPYVGHGKLGKQFFYTADNAQLTIVMFSDSVPRLLNKLLVKLEYTTPVSRLYW